MSSIRDEANFASFAENKSKLRKILDILPHSPLIETIIVRSEKIYPIIDDQTDLPMDADDEDKADEEDKPVVS